MLDNCSRVIQPTRPADVVEYADTKTEFLTRENYLLEEGRQLEVKFPLEPA